MQTTAAAAIVVVCLLTVEADFFGPAEVMLASVECSAPMGTEFLDFRLGGEEQGAATSRNWTGFRARNKEASLYPWIAVVDDLRLTVSSRPPVTSLGSDLASGGGSVDRRINWKLVRISGCRDGLYDVTTVSVDVIVSVRCDRYDFSCGARRGRAGCC